MWLIEIVLGAVLLLAGYLTKNDRPGRLLKIAGIALVVFGLVYGAMAMILVGGID